MKIRTGKQSGDRMILGTSIAVAAALLLSIISAAIMALLIGNESITEVAANKIAILVNGISSLAAAVISGTVASERKGLASIISVGSYFAVLVMTTILFFDGEFEHIVVTAIAIIVGYVISKIPNLKRRKGSIKLNRRKITR